LFFIERRRKNKNSCLLVAYQDSFITVLMKKYYLTPRTARARYKFEFVNEDYECRIRANCNGINAKGFLLLTF